VPARTGTGAVIVETSNTTRALLELTRWADQRGIVLAGLTVDQPTLEDAYLHLTSQGAPAGAPERTTR